MQYYDDAMCSNDGCCTCRPVSRYTYLVKTGISRAPLDGVSSNFKQASLVFEDGILMVILKPSVSTWMFTLNRWFAITFVPYLFASISHVCKCLKIHNIPLAHLQNLVCTNHLIHTKNVYQVLMGKHIPLDHPLK